MKNIFLTIFTLFVGNLLFVSPVFAGGGPIDVEVYPLRPFDQTKTFIIQANVYTKEPCDTIKLNVALKPFKDSNAGDSISPFTPPDDGTYVTRHYNDGSTVGNVICTTYTQVKSEISFQRTAIVSAVVNGEPKSVEVPVSFGTDEYSRQLQSFGRVNDYDNTPQPDIISQTRIDSQARNVAIQWQKIPWAQKYSVFAATLIGKTDKPYYYVSKSQETMPYSRMLSTQDTKTPITLSASLAYHLRVIACKNADEPCDNSNANSYSVMLDAMRDINQQEAVMPQQNEVQITPYEKQQEAQITSVGQDNTNVIPTAIEDKRVEELNKKVAELENKIEESSRKQNLLEQRITALVNWVKSLFPFFK